MTKSSDFNLRPHHSLCIQFFMGKGYSDEFVRSMTEIIGTLNSENPVLKLSEGCDIICLACPENEDGKCKSAEKVAEIDFNCLKEYGLKAGDKIRWSELKNLAFDKIISENKISSVCLDCRWKNICAVAEKN